MSDTEIINIPFKRTEIGKNDLSVYNISAKTITVVRPDNIKDDIVEMVIEENNHKTVIQLGKIARTHLAKMLICT